MSNTDVRAFGDLLTTLRKQRRISQNELADKLDVHRNTIGKWERGFYLPESKTLVLELAKQLRLDENETRQLLDASLTAISPYWNVPYQRNPFFTGREEMLQHLHTVLLSEKTAAITQSHALSGLGGIGKTQMALEYAYQHAPEYTAVFWIGADTYETLTASFLALAEVLNIPEKREQDQSKIVDAVIRWLNSHREWLLIYDNVEDIELVKRFLPTSRGGAILFTTRIHALGTLAHTIEVMQMSQEEGIQFLSRRAKLLDWDVPYANLTPADTEIARTMVELMDGLPLALDQAGAYIEAARCSLSDYLQLFQSSQVRLLDEREFYANHPLSVTRTFALAYERLKQSNPAAAELLTVCAFLAPEAIPETFFIEGAAHLGSTFEVLAADPFQFQNALKALLAYSLLQRNTSTRAVTIHRLVQAVLKGCLPEAVQHAWVARVVGAMTELFPSEEMQADYWQVCDQLLPHAQVCITQAEHWATDEALHVTLMSHVADYLLKHARYAEAELLYERALHVGREHALHPLVTEVLCGLAILYYKQGRYEEAELFYKQALDIGEQVLGPEHPLVTSSLNSLALLYWQQGKYGEAESLYQRVLQIIEQELGPECPQLAKPLNNLAILYKDQGKHEEAELLYRQTLQILEQAFGPEHLYVAYPLVNLGELYTLQEKYEEAERLCERAIRIREQVLEPEHPDMAYPLLNLADLYYKQGKYKEAERLYQRTLRIWEQALGSEHAEVAHSLHGLAGLYYKQGRYKEAERLYQQALTIREQALGLHHLKTNETRTAYTHLLQELGRVEEVATMEY